MGREIVLQWVQYAPAMSHIVGIRSEGTFVLVALDARIDKIVLIVTTTGGTWLVMVDGEFASRVGFGHTTVATTGMIALPHMHTLGVRHSP
jgi:hypothetical protein